MKEQRIALITGASRESGLGFATAKQLAAKGYTVLISGRNMISLEDLVEKAHGEKLELVPLKLDVTSEQSAAEAAKFIRQEFGKLDLLINNAIDGASFDKNAFANIKDIEMEIVEQALAVNVIGAWRMIRHMAPLLTLSDSGKVLNLSSELGKITDMETINAYGGMSLYGLTKTAINALTVKAAQDLKSDGISVNSVAPGFTATYPGFAEQGARPVKDSVEGIIYAAMLPKDGPTGVWFSDRKEIGW